MQISHILMSLKQGTRFEARKILKTEKMFCSAFAKHLFCLILNLECRNSPHMSRLNVDGEKPERTLVVFCSRNESALLCATNARRWQMTIGDEMTGDDNSGNTASRSPLRLFVS